MHTGTDKARTGRTTQSAVTPAIISVFQSFYYYAVIFELNVYVSGSLSFVCKFGLVQSAAAPPLSCWRTTSSAMNKPISLALAIKGENPIK